MSVLRLFSLYDSAAKCYLPPLFVDHKANALRSFVRIVNDKSDPNNMVAAHPDQFTLFEIGEFDLRTGVFTSHPNPITLGNGVEFIKSVAA